MSQEKKEAAWSPYGRRSSDESEIYSRVGRNSKKKQNIKKKIFKLLRGKVKHGEGSGGRCGRDRIARTD